jgi:MFS family permease
MFMKTEKQRLLTPLLLLFMVTMVLANISGRMQGQYESLYLQNLGASIQQVGIYYTIGAIIPLFLQIFGGWLSDKIGRLEAIAIGSVGGVLGYVVYIFAPSWQWLLITSMTSAVAFAFVGPSYMAFIAEQSTEETRGRVYGITNTIFQVVGILGPPLGGFIAQRSGFQAMFIVAGILYTTAAGIRIWMARTAGRRAQSRSSEQPAEKPTFAGLKTSIGAMLGMLAAGGVMTWIFVSDGVRDVAFGMTGQLFPLYMENIRGITLVQIGLLSSVASAVTMVLMSPAGWLSDKYGERVGIVGGFAILSLGWIGFMAARSFPVFIGAWVIFGVGEALISPSYSSLISKVVPENLRGTAFGFLHSSLGLISLPTPYIGAMLWERFGPIVPFYVPLLALLAMLPVMWVKFKLPPASAGSEPVPEAGTAR